MSGKTAVIIGATGLVGSQLVRLMLKDERYDSIVVIVRRALKLKDTKLKEIIVPDFDRLKDFATSMNGHDFYCALGTTRKKAGSKEAFLKVDLDYPIQFAEIAQNHKDFSQFLVVSAVGASSSSPIFYNSAKGQLEDSLQELNLKSLKIFQPSLLLGDRKEYRLFEEIVKVVSGIASFFIIGSKKRVGAIRDVEVAKAMIEVAFLGERGFSRYKPDQMVDIAYK